MHMNEYKEINRRCVDCNTTRTPLWRGGPAGPRSLCNACGIRYRKKNMGLLGLNRDSRTEKSKNKDAIDASGSGIKTFARDMGDLEVKSKLREEEEAAFLLMALSNSNVNVYG
ncbi:GATA transcription factor 16 [Hibiscus trionum]|uniref:GATA transcription factor 16 n=1 Tax=Hibiscus trionum TaxID=183268 RepID=A0A9W7J783_HIBTR|nr:GATA transcription factor 16 [Hibiscus trionum]